MENVHVFVDENRHPSWAELFVELGDLQEQSLFDITQKLVMEHGEEILNVKCLEHSSRSWARSVSSHDQAIKWRKQKYVSMPIPFNVLDR